MRQEGPRDPAERPIQRSRHLEDEEQVWNHNSWDDMPWTHEQEAAACAIITAQTEASPHLDNSDAVNSIVQGPAAARWDRFYQQHDRWFFKDRRWLTAEFPELFDSARGGRILEIGCGAGNTIFPLARFRAHDPNLHIFACDFAPSAVQLVRQSPEYDPKRMTVFVHDLCSETAGMTIDDNFLSPSTVTTNSLLSSSPSPGEEEEEEEEGLNRREIKEGSLDMIIAIFVLSALDPARLPGVLEKLFRLLRPGGLLLFRDYGLYDMTQLRFKAERLVRPSLYVRGDGTAVHYFTEQEVSDLATRAGFQVLSNNTDRRLLVNRYRRLTMYRIWVQAKLMRPTN